MIQRIILPQLGQTMEEGTVEKWHKKEGDTVKKGEILFDLTTDKATLEVESFAEGVLKKILVSEGETVPVNSLVAVVGGEDDEVPDDLDHTPAPAGPPVSAEEPAGSERAAQQTGTAAAAGVTTPPPGDTSRLFVSPRARKIARENSIPLQALRGRGTGPGGRIVQKDVLRYKEQLAGIRLTPAAKETAYRKSVDLLSLQPSATDRITKADVLAAAEKISAAPDAVQLNAMRRTIAKRMALSKQTVPHFYLVGRVNMRTAGEHRRRVNSDGAAHITVTDMLVKATAKALKEHPRMNARFEGDTIVLNPHVNIGVAVAVEDGLFVPVIRDADSRPLSQVSRELSSLASAAREGNLIPEQYEGGSVTISNLGTFGIDSFLPIINPPESCILGIGSIREEIVVEDGAMRIEPLMTVSLSADHRLTDGASAATFFNTFRRALEDPAWMFENL